MANQLNLSDRLLLESLVRKKGLTPDQISKLSGSLPQQKKYLESLFPLQKEILTHPSKFKAIRSGRRFSKTFVVSIALITEALKRPGSSCLFIATSVEAAKRLVWSTLVEFNEKYSLDISFDNASSIATFNNGSKIYLKGCANRKECEKFRGDYYNIVAIDEAQSFPSWLKYLIEEVLSPALQDYQGTLWLTGTTNSTCTGYFYDITANPDQQNLFKVWHHTVFDNPKFPLWADKDNWQEIARNWWLQYLLERGLTEDDPQIQREWFAEWIRDNTTLVFPSLSTYLLDELPNDLNYVIGIDVGFIDAFAVVVLGYTDNAAYLVDAYSASETSTDEKLEVLNRFHNRYNPVITVCDPGGGGKQFIHDFNLRYNQNIQVANKREKPHRLQLLSDDLKNRKLLINPDLTDLLYSLKILEYSNKSKGEIPESYPQDYLDSCLVGSTLIETINGPKPIKDIRLGELVLTRSGYREVLWSGMTKANAELYRIEFSDGSSIIGTREHPIYITELDDFISIGDIQCILTTQATKLKVEKELMTLNLSVLNAGRLLSETNTLSQDIVHVVAVQKLLEQDAVYNLTVADHPEFFANGILVHNCSYAHMELPWALYNIQPKTKKIPFVDGYDPHLEYLKEEQAQQLAEESYQMQEYLREFFDNQGRTSFS